MASSLVQFRADDTDKLIAMQICDKLGLSLQAYLRICLSRLIQEKGIPFSMNINEETNSGIAAMKRASQIAAENGISDMSLNEINAEISAARESVSP